MRILKALPYTLLRGFAFRSCRLRRRIGSQREDQDHWPGRVDHDHEGNEGRVIRQEPTITRQHNSRPGEVIDRSGWRQISICRSGVQR